MFVCFMFSSHRFSQQHNNKIEMHLVRATGAKHLEFLMYILTVSSFSYVFSLETVVKLTLKSEREAMRSSSSFVAVEAGGAPEW